MDAASVDARIAGASAPARGLLWVITRAREALTARLIERIWGGESLEREMLRKLAGELAALPAAMREQLEAQLPAEVLVQMNTLPPVSTVAPPPAGPLLEELEQAGLVRREGVGDDAPFGAPAEVAERIAAWIDTHPEERGARTEAQIWRTLGERYVGAFEALAGADDADTQALAAQTGERGIRYLVRATHEALPAIAAQMLAAAREDALREQVIAGLAAAADEAPKGEERWKARAAIAEGIDEAARGESATIARALSLFEQSVDEAEVAGSPDGARIAAQIGRRWAAALEQAGQKPAARDAFRRSAGNARRAGLPRAVQIDLELEATRLGIRQGGDVEAIEAAIARYIEELAAMPDDEGAAEVQVRALELGAQVDMALDRWEPALARLDQHEAILAAHGADDHTLALARGQRYLPLARLQRFDEAARVLDAALAVFLEVEDRAAEVGTRSRLADLWDERGDAAKAVEAARAALRASEQQESVELRAGCHENLATYLEKAGDLPAARLHQLADLVYRVVARLDMTRALQALSFDVLRASARGERHALPRLAEALEGEELAGLRRFLDERSAPLAALQQGIDELVATVQAGTKTSAPAG